MTTQQQPVSDPVNILLVDDRPAGILAMECVLACPEYNLVTATSGEEALRHFLRDDFAVVLLDVQMPGIDGFETARRMRRAEGAHKTPIIFVTALSVEDRYIYTGYETGAVDYVFKPFNPVILRSKVAVFADLRRMHQELERRAEMIRNSERRDRERLLAELELASLRRYQNLADAIPHIIWRARPDWSLDYFNKVWTDYTGLSAAASAGDGWRHAVAAEDLGGLTAAWREAARRGAGFEAECRIRRAADAALRWHLVRAVPEVGADGKLTSWLATSTEIHDRKTADEERAALLRLEQAARLQMQTAMAQQRQAEAELIRAKEAAEDASRAKSQLLANMSHEIRTPLGIVLGVSELLLDDELTADDRSESLQTILRNGRQLGKLVDDILDLSKVEAGRLELEALTVPLWELLEELKATVGFQARQKGLTLAIELAPGVPPLIRTDPTRLRQVLTNVVGNAVKFTERGTITVRVSATPDRAGAGQIRLAFVVEDTGVGIPPQVLPRLFQDFTQADATTTRRFGGTGLGLALSRRLCRLLGGDLELERSAVGDGSAFAFWLTVECVRPSASTAEAAPAARERFEGTHVLVVDDAPDNQFLVKRLLQRVGVTVDLANDGREGIARAMAGDYDLVLMDIQMPTLDGYEATAELRARGYDRPIIALTAHAMKEERDRCLARGFTDHLTKPISQRELLAHLRRHGCHIKNEAGLAGRAAAGPHEEARH